MQSLTERHRCLSSLYIYLAILTHQATETVVNIRRSTANVKNLVVSEVVSAANEFQIRVLLAIPRNPATDTLSFTMSRKNISNDQQRIYEKGYNEIALEKSECAEQQTNYY